MWINLDDLTELEDTSVFEFLIQPFKSYEKDYDVQVDVTIEMELNMRVVAREGYTFLDYLSDIGGMQGMIASFIAAFVVFWNYNNFANYMVQRLYKIEKKDAKKKVYTNYDDRSEFIYPCCMSNARDAICDILPSCLQCCRSGKQDKSIAMGRDKLEKESNIIEIIKSRRYFNASLKILLSKRQRMRLKERTRYLHVNPRAKQNSDSDATDFLTDELLTDPEERFLNGEEPKSKIDIDLNGTAPFDNSNSRGTTPSDSMKKIDLGKNNNQKRDRRRGVSQDYKNGKNGGKDPDSDWQSDFSEDEREDTNRSRGKPKKEKKPEPFGKLSKGYVRKKTLAANGGKNDRGQRNSYGSMSSDSRRR